MTIREANMLIKQIDNDIKLLECDLIIHPNDVQQQDLLKKQEKKENLEKWVIRELRIIKEYEPLKAKIIKLRQESHLTWDAISEATNYSKRQCINIYKDYTERRMSEIEKTSDYLRNVAR